MKQLFEEPKTAKQVATELDHTPGNVHYHIKKLLEGELLTLVEERKVGGVMEKYYQSVAGTFYAPDEARDPVLRESFDSDHTTSLMTRVELTTSERDQMQEEFADFLEKWVERSTKAVGEARQEYSVGINIVSTKPKYETNGEDD
ncbi:helix-turn-helix domain-containing protein [Paenalkalicoccus suaedae]|uniref:Helix-turn-helix domain-containing protein n=2 Tax=Paenalkalicoccus suaedae TaxID=2592382 RepID=A0A859FKN1_9BACI|nr:helix-turn-helix domain-containing protein [Paenalkalicoccus suaedae]